MIDKVLLGISILLASNLLVSTLTLKTQAIVMGLHTSNTILALVCILAGAMLGSSIRGISTGGKDSIDEDW